MAALFPSRSNTVFRVLLVLMALTPPAALVALMVYVRTPWNTDQFVRVDQPVEFDHRHHVVDDEIECLYCHREAETSATAGVPSTDVCMGCHAQVWNESPLLEPVRRSYFSNQPIPWNRVHNLADFAYFNHAVHVQRGIGCVQCHGRVDQMARVEKVESLQMRWCLDCHRNADRFPGGAAVQTASYDAFWGMPARRDTEVETVRAITPLTTCTACHR